MIASNNILASEHDFVAFDFHGNTCKAKYGADQQYMYYYGGGLYNDSTSEKTIVCPIQWLNRIQGNGSWDRFTPEEAADWSVSVRILDNSTTDQVECRIVSNEGKDNNNNGTIDGISTAWEYYPAGNSWTGTAIIVFNDDDHTDPLIFIELECTVPGKVGTERSAIAGFRTQAWDD
jgi:hypothetical protein